MNMILYLTDALKDDYEANPSDLLVPYFCHSFSRFKMSFTVSTTLVSRSL
jgi:hypothetical protein